MNRLLVCVLLCACGQKSFQGDDDVIDDSGVAKDSTTASDSPTSSDSPTGGPTKFGTVSASSWDYVVASTPAKGHSASAGFYATTYPSSCKIEKDGACYYYECGTGPSDAGTPVGTSAGVISITGGNTPITLTPSGGTYTAISNTTAPLFAGGESLSVSAAGSSTGVPAFDLSLTAPSILTLTVPVVTSITISRSTGFVVKWTGGGDGMATVSIAEVVSGVSHSISCQFSASAGTGTVPQTTLAKLVPTTQGSFSMSNQASTNTTKGEWGLYFYATTLCKSATGPASGLATIQ